jgi:hypothetical protein
MKKLVFVFVAVAAVSLASCGNKTANNNAAPTEETTTVAPAETTVAPADSAATVCDSTKVDSAKVAE